MEEPDVILLIDEGDFRDWLVKKIWAMDKTLCEIRDKLVADEGLQKRIDDLEAQTLINQSKLEGVKS